MEPFMEYAQLVNWKHSTNGTTEMPYINDFHNSYIYLKIGQEIHQAWFYAQNYFNNRLKSS